MHQELKYLFSPDTFYFWMQLQHFYSIPLSIAIPHFGLFLKFYPDSVDSVTLA